MKLLTKPFAKLFAVTFLLGCGPEPKQKVSCDKVFPLSEFNRYGKPVLVAALNNAPARDNVWFSQAYSVEIGEASQFPVTDSSFSLVEGTWRWTGRSQAADACSLANVFHFPVTTITLTRMLGNGQCRSSAWSAEVTADKRKWSYRKYQEYLSESGFQTYFTATTLFSDWVQTKIHTEKDNVYHNRIVTKRYGGTETETQTGCVDNSVGCGVRGEFSHLGTISLGGIKYTWAERGRGVEISTDELTCAEKILSQTCGVFRMMHFFPQMFLQGPLDFEKLQPSNCY